MWQDTAVFIGTLALSYGLGFQVYRNFKEKSCDIKLRTSFISMLGVVAICVSLATLGLLYSAVINAIIAVLWLVLFLQKLSYKK